MSLAIISEDRKRDTKTIPLSRPTEKIKIEEGEVFSWLEVFRMPSTLHCENTMLKYGSSVASIMIESSTAVRVRIEGKKASEIQHLIEVCIEAVGGKVVNLTPTPLITTAWWEKLFRRILEIKKEMDSHIS